MRFNEAPPVTGSIPRAFWRFRSRNRFVYWVTCPLWFPAIVIAGYGALGLAKLGHQAERFLGALGIDPWK